MNKKAIDDNSCAVYRFCCYYDICVDNGKSEGKQLFSAAL